MHRLIRHFIDFNKVILSFIISRIIKLSIKDKDIWIISERKEEAEDNGYHLFKYIRINHPTQKVFYLIDKNSKAYEKVKLYGNIIQYNSLMHYIYYFLSDKHISAFQFFGVPETAILWKLEKLKLIKKKKVFIQHGITKEDLPFLKYNLTNYRLFICGAEKEYKYVKQTFNYPKQNVVYTGLCRFDNLQEFATKNRIVIMPTWRKWFGMTGKDMNESQIDIFIKSQYFNKYQSLINNKLLINILEENDFELLFYPHPEMQRFIHNFKSKSERIKIINRKSSNLQEIIKESKILITDYSSIAFDFAYMKKPIIYYQFDKDDYYKNHFTKGYFDCERDGFGEVIESEEELINLLKFYIKSNEMKPLYKERAENFFPLHDKNNCKRNYEAIKEI